MQDILQKMTPEERQAYMANVVQQKQHQEVMDAIHAQDRQISQIIERCSNNNWLASFTSDVLGNFTSVGILKIYASFRLLPLYVYLFLFNFAIKNKKIHHEQLQRICT